MASFVYICSILDFPICAIFNVRCLFALLTSAISKWNFRPLRQKFSPLWYYFSFCQIVSCFIVYLVYNVAPFKTVRVKNNNSQWFDGEIANKIRTCYNKLYKRCKLTKLRVDEEIYKEAGNAIQNLIRRKKKAHFEKKLKENTKNPKKALDGKHWNN